MIIQFGYMLNIFQKLTKCVHHFRENNWLLCVTSDESWAFKEKLEYKKITSTSFPIFKDVAEKFGGDKMTVAFDAA